MRLMKRGELAGAVGQKPRLVGRLALQQAVNALEGKPVKARVETPFVIVTPQNMNTAKAKEAQYTSLNC
jgi:ABC-type sugar transport system substrate-binding protein